MNFVFDLPSLLFSSFCQSTVFNTRSCICSSKYVADGTYGRPDCPKAHIGHGSGRPKGAAFTHTHNERFLFYRSARALPVSSGTPSLPDGLRPCPGVWRLGCEPAGCKKRELFQSQPCLAIGLPPKRGSEGGGTASVLPLRLPPLTFATQGRNKKKKKAVAKLAVATRTCISSEPCRTQALRTPRTEFE